LRLSSKKETGDRAESKACVLLRQTGFQVLARNIRFYGTEIDILARNLRNIEKEYVLVEVKCSLKRHYLSGYPLVSPTQIKRYYRAIDRWQSARNRYIHSYMRLMIFDENMGLLDNYPVAPVLPRKAV